MGSKRFSEYLSKSIPFNARLPFVHTTRAFRFDDIKLSDALIPTRCEVFQTNLLYLFYGRPAYKVKKQINPRLAFDWPVVFIIDPTRISNMIESVYPFDSGAFFHGFFSQYFDTDNRLDDFCLDEGVESIRKILGSFYRNDFEYLTAASRKNVDISLSDFEAAGVHELTRTPPISTFTNDTTSDERCSSIEAILTDRVPLDGNVIAVIFPELLLDDRNNVEYFKQMECNVFPYSIIGFTDSQTIVGSVYSKVIDAYRELWFLDK